MSHNSPQSTHSTSLKLRLLTLSFGLTIAGSLLVPILARAGVLDELSGTLNQTVSNVTNAALNPIQGVETKINNTIGQTERDIDSILSKNPVGTLLGGVDTSLQSVFAPIEQQILAYLQAFQSFFQRSIGSLLGGLLGGGNASNPANDSDVIINPAAVDLAFT